MTDPISLPVVGYAVRAAWLAIVFACCAPAQEPGGQQPQQQQKQQPEVAPPQRFERILWCSDKGGGPKLARKNGYTAVQLGRGGDATPLRSLGLRFYLDQPIGKGLLELRDNQWRPVVQLFERTRDPLQLQRPTCFAAPGVVDKAAAAAAEEARRIGKDGMLFVALADEASSTRHNAPLDTCQCEHCLRDFRRFLVERYKDIDGVNAAFGTHYESIDVAVPVSTDQVRTRELGERQLPADLRAYSAWLDFVDQQFAAAVQSIRKRVEAALPTVPVGLTGLAVPGPYGGHDYSQLIDGHMLAEPYDVGGSIELCRSFVPAGAHRYATLAPPATERQKSVSVDRWVRARLAAMASQGMAGVVVWNDATVASDKGEQTPFGRAVRQAFVAHGAEFDALAGAEIATSPVWVIESHASVRAWWMLDSAKDGMTWVRRLASYEETHSTSQAARKSWIRLLQDLGHQPRFVSSNGLADRLLVERPRAVVLPATLALGDRAVQALNVYVRTGGTVLADHSTALYDDELKRRDRGALDDLFGIKQRSLLWNDLLVREGVATSREPGLPPAERLLRGERSRSESDTDTALEQSIGRGRAYYLNAPVAAYHEWRLDVTQVARCKVLRRIVRSALRRAKVFPVCQVTGKGLPTCIERVPLRLRDGRELIAVRINALERPRLLETLARRGPIEIELTFPKERHFAELNGKDHGVTSVVKTTLDPFGAVFLGVVK